MILVILLQKITPEELKLLTKEKNAKSIPINSENFLAPELVEHCRKIYSDSRSESNWMVVTGNQTVVSTLSHAILKDWGSHESIFLWSGKLTPITENSNPEWLAQFDLGDLYVHGDFK